jgi:hypothetical protein
MTTQTQTKTHACILCGKPNVQHTPDGINFFCQNPTSCLDSVQARLEQTGYRDATPEMYKLFKAREAQAKAYWTKCVLESRDLKAALGLDDTTFLTHMKLLAEMETEGDEEC